MKNRSVNLLSANLLACVFLLAPVKSLAQDAENPSVERGDIDRTEGEIAERIVQTGEDLEESAGDALRNEFSRDRNLIGQSIEAHQNAPANSQDDTPNDDSDAAIERDIDRLQAE